VAIAAAAAAFAAAAVLKRAYHGAHILALAGFE
jgi:hypothetical protein